jgi:hypothetical protein
MRIAYRVCANFIASGESSRRTSESVQIERLCVTHLLIKLMVITFLVNA